MGFNLRAVKGSLLIGVVMLMTVMGLIAASIAYMMTNNAQSTSNQGISTQAFYLAQAGLEAGLSAVAIDPLSNTSGVANRMACAAINGNPSYTNVSLGAGTFTVTGTFYSPTPSTLSAAITSSSTVIPMASVVGYADMGSVVIENEIIDYGSVGTSTSECGSGISACLLGVRRGANASLAAAHASGMAVSHMLCELTATGGVPSVASPKASRTIQRNVMFAEPHAVGAVSSGELTQLWTGASWARIGPSASIGNIALNDISLIHSSDGWAVGNINTGACTSNSNGLFIRFNGAAWNPVCSTSGSSTGVDQNLSSVSCSGSNFCKAVGATNKSIAGWNGTAWAQDASNSSMPNVTYNAVDCPAASLCFAVGNALTSGTKAKKYEVVIQWSAGAWERIDEGAITNATTVSNTTNFLGIDCPSTAYCIAVGTARTFVQYNGAWSVMTTSSIPNVQYNAVSCVSSSDCWAVGNVSTNAVFVRWNGSTWTQVIGAGVPAQNMLDVKCAATDACWAVGANGAAAFWNGSVWANASAGNPAVSINGVTTLIGPQWKDRVFAWREVFN